MAENTVKTNPLTSLMRQPKIYITLPSGGKYWPEGTLNPTVNGEYPVYSMTAKDEIILKTPDALMNGQGLVDVIQSCIPNIKNAWEAPSIDLDVILVAIRMATYGETMNLEVSHSSMDDTMTFNVNLREILDSLQSTIVWDERLEVRPDLVLYLKPTTYQIQANTQITEFETSRLMNIIKDEALDEDVKLQAFKDSFEKMSNKTLNLITKTVYKIESTAGTVTEPEYIDEFMNNCDKEIFEKVKTHLEALGDRNKLKPLKVKSTEEMKARGAPEELEVPFDFNASNFFG